MGTYSLLFFLQKNVCYIFTFFNSKRGFLFEIMFFSLKNFVLVSFYDTIHASTVFEAMIREVVTILTRHQDYLNPSG